MPLIQNFDLMDVTLSQGLAGTYGESSPAGLLVHRYVVDMASHTPKAIVNYTMFNPDSAIFPILFFGAYFFWHLDDAEADNTEVGIEGAAAPDNILASGPISQASNDDIRGASVNDFGTTSTMIDMQGLPLHRHLARAISTVTGMPIYLHVDATPASVNPYSGKIMAYLLFMSLA